MPTGGSSGTRSSSLRRRPQQTVQLSLPHHHQHHHDQQHSSRDANAGSKTPSSQHQQRTLPWQPSIFTLLLLKRRLREVRARLQFQQQQQRLHSLPGRGSGKPENSYHTQPPAAFASPLEAQQVLANSLQFFLGESRYSPRACAKLVRMVAEDAKRRLKAAAGSPRFKIVVTATVVQKARQGAAEASRCLMDGGCDCHVTACLERPTFLASATAYWFYYE